MRPSNNLENKIPSEKYCTVALVCTSSCLQFFTTTTGIQSGLGSYREVLEKILEKLFALSDAKDNNSGLLNRGVKQIYLF